MTDRMPIPDEDIGDATPLVGSGYDFRRAARIYGLAVVLVVVAVIFEILTDGLFLSKRNIPIMLRQLAVVGIVAAGVALVLISGHIDLSIGSAVGLCAIVAAWMLNIAELPVPVAIGASLATGLVLGAWQGFLVSVLTIPSFVVTLGGLLIFRGIGLVITEGNTIASFPSDFLVFGSGQISGVIVIVVVASVAAAISTSRIRQSPTPRKAVLAVAPIAIAALALTVLTLLIGTMPLPVGIFLIVASVLGFVANRTKFGRKVYASGGNSEAALLAGISVRRTSFVVFLIMGGIYGVAGIVLAARLNGAPPGGAPFLELSAIAAAVIGGVSLLGGAGRIGGAVLGTILLGMIANGLSLMNVPTFWQLIVSGLILITAVGLDVQAKKRR